VQKRSLWRYTVVEVRELRLSINRVLRARAFAYLVTCIIVRCIHRGYYPAR